jgi:hypothetical protein
MLVCIELLGLLGALMASLLMLRAVRSRPTLSITSSKGSFSGAVLRITNPSQAPIVIREVIFQPEVYALALSGGPTDLLCRLAAHADAELPLVISDRPLEAEIKSPVRIIVRWRKAKARWSPQIPAGLWISKGEVNQLRSTVVNTGL